MTGLNNWLDIFVNNQEELAKTKNKIRDDFRVLRDTISQLVGDSEQGLLKLVEKEHLEIAANIEKNKERVVDLGRFIEQNAANDFKVDLNKYGL